MQNKLKENAGFLTEQTSTSNKTIRDDLGCDKLLPTDNSQTIGLCKNIYYLQAVEYSHFAAILFFKARFQFAKTKNKIIIRLRNNKIIK